MDHQKSNYLLIFGILSSGGCWGQPMPIFWKWADETQTSKPQDVKTSFKQNITCIYPSNSNYFCQFTMRHHVCRYAYHRFQKLWVEIYSRQSGPSSVSWLDPLIAIIEYLSTFYRSLQEDPVTTHLVYPLVSKLEI